MKRSQVRFRHSILAEHLSYHELGVAADQVALPGPAALLSFPQVVQEEDQGLVLGDVVASNRAVGRVEILHLADHPSPVHDIRDSNTDIVPELVPRTGPVEEARCPCGTRGHGW